jgi:hypothetical protein
MSAASKDLSKRKKNSAVAEQHVDQPISNEPTPNPAWFKPVMFGFMLAGLIWIVLYYITSSSISLPIPALAQGNIFVGFGLVLVGFLMTTRWR